MPSLPEGCRFYLAREVGPRNVDLVDGGHDDPSGVSKAARMYARVYRDEGPWVMVGVMDMPEERTEEMRNIIETEALFEQLQEAR